MSYGSDNLSFAPPRPLASVVGAYAPATPEAADPAAPAKIAPKSAEKVEEETSATVDAKAALGATQAPAMGAAASALKSAKDADADQLTADSLKLTSQTLAKATPSASSLNGASQIISGLNKAAQGDAFGAASAASAAAEKIAPALAKSGVGAIASAVIIGAGDQKLGEQAKALKQSVKKAVNPDATGVQRTKAALDVAIHAQNLANLGRTVGAAAVNVGRYGVKLAGKAPALAPAAESVKGAATVFQATRVGRAIGFLNKWIPLLNVAGVALSAKTAVDVFRTHGASKTSKALSIASLATAGAALWAGFALPGAAFLGVIAASIGLDVMLAGARKRDAGSADMDAQARRWATHPGELAGDLGAWIARTVPAIGRKAIALGGKARARLTGGEPAATLDPRRALT
jgi:hypothetical protein